MKKRTFIDMFSGIGGFHLAFHSLGAKCVFASEIDIHARKTYEHNFKKISPLLFKSNNFLGDILEVDSKIIPDFDILCAGFPCQPFSQAGYKQGFQDIRENRGNMFFEIVRIIEDKNPAAFFLENVRHLKNHDNGRTFNVIKKTLESLGYSFIYKIVKASEHGLPQHRPRLFMVGFKGEETKLSTFKFPEPEPLNINMSNIFNGKCNREIGFTLRVGGRGSGINDRRNWDMYLVDNKVVKLSIVEGKKMMGFPSSFHFQVSEVQAMKQLGNSVAVNAIKATASNILKHLDNIEKVRIKNKQKTLVGSNE